MKSSHAIVGFLTIATLLSGCASYRASSLGYLAPEATQSDSPKGVSVACKAFNHQDCKKYLDRDVLSKGYQPVQIAIHNNTNKSYLINANGIGLPLAKSEEVAEKVHTSTVGRVVGYGVGSLFIWPLIIPAIVDGIKSSEANEHLDKDFASKEVKEEIIYPKTSVNALLFVPKDEYNNTFTITLIDLETKLPEQVQVTAVRG